MGKTENIFECVKFDSAGLVPAIAQDNETGEILMQAYMNSEALTLTVQTGIVHYYSRSRKKLWKKGEESGNIQKLKELYIDCDGDCILLKIEQVGGAACHTGHRSCFFRKLTKKGLSATGEKIFDPNAVYGKKK